MIRRLASVVGRSQGWKLLLGGWLGCMVLLGACGSRSDTIVSIALHPTKPHILYVATDEAVYKTRDGGRTWTRLDSELKRTRVISLAIHPKFPATIFAGTMGDGTYKSPDGGRTWHHFKKGIQKSTISAIVNQIVFDPGAPDLVYAATTVGVFRSTDGGRTWQERTNGMSEVNFVVCLAIDPARPYILYAGTTGGVYRTRNATERWEKVTTGMVAFDAKMASMAIGVNVLVIDPVNPDVVYAGTTQGLYRSANQGDQWALVQSLGDKYISGMQIDPTNPKILYVATSQGVHKSVDGGQAWQLKSTGLDATSIRTIQISPLDPLTLYVGTNGGGLYRTSDGGETWERLPLTPASAA